MSALGFGGFFRSTIAAASYPFKDYLPAGNISAPVLPADITLEDRLFYEPELKALVRSQARR
jgi:hypothetical protein